MRRPGFLDGPRLEFFAVEAPQISIQNNGNVSHLDHHLRPFFNMFARGYVPTVDAVWLENFAYAATFDRLGGLESLTLKAAVNGSRCIPH